MKSLFLFLLLPCQLLAQTKTTVELDNKYDGMSLYFYKNTLKMLNQKDDKDFDELIKDIEKMRFVLINKTKHSFQEAGYATLKKSYRGESYEEVMSGRMEGKKFDVLVREVNGNVKGTVILASDSASLYVLDVLGKVAINKASALFNALDGSTDVEKMIKDFAGGNKGKRKSESKKDDNKDDTKNN